MNTMNTSNDDDKAMISSSTFRSPCFSMKGSSINNNNGSNNNNNNNNNNEGQIDLSHILNYTNKYHQREVVRLKNQRSADNNNDDKNNDDDMIFIGSDSDDHNNDGDGDSADDGSYQKKNHEEATDNNDYTNNQSSSHTTSNNTSNNTSSDSVHMDKAIRMLEPHLISFRKLCNVKQGDDHDYDRDNNADDDNDNNNNDDYDDDDDNLVTKIPPALIRVARFFPFKWVPIRQALLRPQHPSEVEVGINTRLSLANALYKKGILAGAEIHRLKEAHKRKKYTDTSTGSTGEGTIHTDVGADTTNQRKRRKENNHDITTYDKLRIAFARMPIDLASSSTANAALRHLKVVIDDYCKILQSQLLSDGNGNGNNNGNENKVDKSTRSNSQSQSHSQSHSLPSLDQVADWALVSFSAVLLSNGFEDLKFGSEEYHFESKMVSLLQATSNQSHNHNQGSSMLANAMDRRIRELMELDALEQASNLNHLCLVRYLSYLPNSQVENMFLSSIIKSYNVGCGRGVSLLPKFFASYISIASRKKVFQLDVFETNLRYQLKDSHQHQTGSEQQVLTFFDLVFQTTKYLLNNSHQGEEA